MNLSELKGDMGLLQAVLGVQVNAHGMAKCPFHEDAQPSFNAKLIDGVARWKCFAGCGSGTIIDAAMLAYGVDTPKSALAQIEKRLGITLARDEDYVEPIIDRERAFNAAAGFSKADDRLPEFMKYEQLPPHNTTWDVPDEALDAVLG